MSVTGKAPHAGEEKVADRIGFNFHIRIIAGKAEVS